MCAVPLTVPAILFALYANSSLSSLRNGSSFSDSLAVNVTLAQRWHVMQVRSMRQDELPRHTASELAIRAAMNTYILQALRGSQECNAKQELIS